MDLVKYSPYIDEPDGTNPLEEPDVPDGTNPLEEPIYTGDTAQKIKQMYISSSNLLQTIIKMYKTMSKPVSKQLWEKTAKDIQDDTMSAKYDLNLDNFVKDSCTEILSMQQNSKNFKKKLEMVPVIIDFCYIYYVHYFDDTAPFHKLPATLFKYRLISNTLCAYGPTYNTVNSIFEQIIENDIIIDMCQSPPYHLRTDLTEMEIKEKMEIHVLPIIKNLINSILKLKRTETISISLISEKIKIKLPTSMSRIDNVDNFNN
jgi:hypothetical protein